MSSRTWMVALPLAAALASIAAAPRAHACSPPSSGVSSTIPADGEKYPGNAAVILQGQGISLTDASVTVDGQPSSLKQAAGAVFSNETGFFGMFVQPAPAAGQNVLITGTFCPAGSGCAPVTLHYQATAAFLKPPAPVEIDEIDVHAYPDFKSSGGDCQSDSSHAWWLHLKSSIPDRATEGVVLYEIMSTHGGGGPEYVARGIVTASWNPVLAVRGGETDFGDQPLPEWKQFSVTTLGSNGSKPSEPEKSAWGTCHYRVDMVPSTSSPPGEPMWTAADIYPGGPCDVTTSTTGAGGSGGGGASNDQVVGGCGCRVAGDAESSTGRSGALILALGASLRLARRRRR